MAIGIAIPVAVWAGEQRFDDVPPDDPGFDAIEWLASVGITNGCMDGTVFCPDDDVTRREHAVFTMRTADNLMARLLVVEGDSGGTMGIGATTLAEGDISVSAPAVLSVTGHLSAAFDFGSGPSPGIGGGAITDVEIWVQVDNPSCASGARVAAMTLAEEGTEPLASSATIVEGTSVDAGAHTVTLCGETVGGFDALVISTGFSAVAVPNAMSDLDDDGGGVGAPSRS